MRRKLIKQGKDSFTLTLPKEWIKKYEFKPSQEIELIQKKGELIITPPKRTTHKSIEVDISNLGNKSIRRYLKVLFKVGYTDIKIFFNHQENCEFIRKLCREEMIGFEIVNQRENYLVLKEVALTIPEEFDNLLRRVFLIIKDIMDEITKIIGDGDIAPLPLLIERDSDVNKLTDHCRRILYLEGFSSSDKTPLVYVIVEGLEKIGDTLRDFCKFMLQKKKFKISRDLKDIYKSVKDYFNTFYNSFYDFKIENIENIENNRVKFIEKIRMYSKRTRTYSETEGLIILNATYELIYDLTGPLIALKS